MYTRTVPARPLNRRGLPKIYARRHILEDVPATDDLALSFAHSYVIANNHEFDAVGLVSVCSGILLLCQTEVENITSVVPRVDALEWSTLSYIQTLLDDDDSSTDSGSVRSFQKVAKDKG